MKRITLAKYNRLSLLAYLRATFKESTQVEFSSNSEVIINWQDDSGCHSSAGHMLYWLKKEGFIREVMTLNKKGEWVSKKKEGRKVYRLLNVRDLSQLSLEEKSSKMDLCELTELECEDETVKAELIAKGDYDSICLLYVLDEQKATMNTLKRRWEIEQLSRIEKEDEMSDYDAYDDEIIPF